MGSPQSGSSPKILLFPASYYHWTWIVPIVLDIGVPYSLGKTHAFDNARAAGATLTLAYG
jgi:hypothetical protein